jgi:hypothetical protein
MHSTKQPASPAERLRVMQIINVALVMGAGMFLMIALFVDVRRGQPPLADFPLLTYVGVALGAVQLVLHRLVPHWIAARQIKQLAAGRRPEGSDDDAAALWSILQTRQLIALALLESACFFLLIAYLLEKELVAGLSAGLILVAMASRFPTASSVESRIGEQQEVLAEERALAGR